MDIKDIIKNHCGFSDITYINRINTFKGKGSKLFVYSVGFRYSGEKKIFVKLAVSNEKSIELRQDYGFYSKNFRKLNDNPFLSFPKVYCCMGNVLVEEFIDGENLEDLFFSSRLKDPDKTFRSIGKGLKYIQESFNLDSIDKSFFRKLNNIDYSRKSFPAKLKKKISHYLSSLDSSDFMMKNTVNFGDFQLKNIMLARSDKLYIIDFNVFFGSRFMDASLFIFSIKWHLIRPSLLLFKKRFTVCINSFLSGFLKEKKDTKLLHFNLLYLLVQNYVLLDESDRNIIVKKYMGMNVLSQINCLLDKGIMSFINS